MINRQLIRLKAIQLFYAHIIGGDKSRTETEKHFAYSLDCAHELYLYLLNLLIDLRRNAERLAETAEARNARLRITDATPIPERYLANNQWLNTLERNVQLLDYREHHTERTDAERALIKLLTTSFVNSEAFQAYLSSADFSAEADQEIVRRLYRTIITTEEEFEPVLEENNLYWNDDKTVVDTFVLKTIKRILPNGDGSQPLLPAWSDDDDREFATVLMHTALERASETHELINRFCSKRWELARVPMMDIIILQVAIAELMSTNNIPISITINEYINITKWYSTPQSFSFVNAMLETIAKHLKDDGAILKSWK